MSDSPFFPSTDIPIYIFLVFSFLIEITSFILATLRNDLPEMNFWLTISNHIREIASRIFSQNRSRF